MPQDGFLLDMICKMASIINESLKRHFTSLHGNRSCYTQIVKIGPSVQVLRDTKSKDILRNRKCDVFAHTAHVVAAPHGFTFQVSSKSTQGFQSHRGSKLSHSHYLDYWVLQQFVLHHKLRSAGTEVNIYSTVSYEQTANETQ